MNKLFTCITIVGFSLAMAGLLAGFAPPPQQKQLWQGKLSSTSSSYVRMPLSDPDADIWRASRACSHSQRIATGNPLPEGRGNSQTLLTFDNSGVSLLTHLGPRQFLGLEEATALIALTTPNFLQANAAIPTPFREVAPLVTNAQQEHVTPVVAVDWAAGFVCLTMPYIRQSTATTPLPSFSRRMATYKPTIQLYAQKYDLDLPLVMAIIHIESGFNPTLISSRGAHGLMQVVPQTAGGDVHRWLGKNGLPTPAELLEPEFNIRYGVAYLHLLRTQHFAGVVDQESLEYCMIAAYNGGPGAVLRLFSRDRAESVNVINSLTPEEVFAKLTKNFPARETRDFLRNVLNSRRHFTILAQAG